MRPVARFALFAGAAIALAACPKKSPNVKGEPSASAKPSASAAAATSVTAATSTAPSALAENADAGAPPVEPPFQGDFLLEVLPTAPIPTPPTSIVLETIADMDETWDPVGAHPKTPTKRVATSGGGELVFYEFEDVRTSDWGLDLRKNGKRVALFKSVLDYTYNKKLDHLYLEQETKVGVQLSIVELPSGVVHYLPNLDCTGRMILSDDDRLMAYSGRRSETAEGTGWMTKFCIFDDHGGLVGKLRSPVRWSTAASDYLAAQFGMLTADPNVFYLFDTQTTMNVYAIDLTNPLHRGAFTTVPPPDDAYARNPVGADFSEFTLASPKLRIRAPLSAPWLFITAKPLSPTK